MFETKELTDTAYVFTKTNDRNYYRNIEKKIQVEILKSYNELYAKHRFKNREPYDQYWINTLTKILTNRDYSSLTTKEGIKDTVEQYTTNQYFNFIYDYIEFLSQGYNLENYVTKVGDKYYISSSNIKKMLETYLDMRDRARNIEEFQAFYETPIVEPQNVVYNPPSNKLREAVLNNTQTSLKNSSYLGVGMYAYSDVGRKREKQEDSYYIGTHPSNPDFKLLVVADGMGGLEDGEKASNITVSELLKWFESLPPEEFYNSNNYNLENKLREKVAEISEKVRNSTYNGGSTLCLSIIKQNSILMGNIGDSQGYIVVDDKLVYTTIPENLPTKMGVPSQFVRYHKDSNKILQRIGGRQQPDLKVDYMLLQPNKSYRVILCSDGVTDCLSESSIIDLATKDSPAQALVEKAIYKDSILQEELAKLSRGKQAKIKQEYGQELKSSIMGGKDNTTAVVADIPRRRR